MPAGRAWGSTSGVDIDVDGTSVWVAERCGAFAPPSLMKPGTPFACDGSSLPPILKFDSSGTLVKAFGEGLLLFPHGLHVDRDGNVWVTDGLGKDGKGHQVFKFSPDGRVLMRLGKAGVAGDGPDEFNAPSAVLVASNGDIFVADGHGGNTNARIVKFSKDGKFIKSWGKKGSSPGEFDIPHALAMDSRGRLFVGDRQNNRIQIFDQDGKLHRSVVPVQPPKRCLHRQEGHDLCRRFRIGVGLQEPRRLEARHPSWKSPRRRRDRVHSGSGGEDDRHERGRGRRGGCARKYLWGGSRAKTPDEIHQELTRREARPRRLIFGRT
jgi:sugar lactone lactonase YvrE